MATTTLTVNPQLITVSGTSAHEINFDNMLGQGFAGLILMTMVTGTAVKFNTKAPTTSDSASYTAGDHEVFEVIRGKRLHYTGGSGSETFKVNVVPN